MDLFKVTDASEALRAWDVVRYTKENDDDNGPDFSFITPNLLGKL
mgnify:CR=1 FL=1